MLIFGKDQLGSDEVAGRQCFVERSREPARNTNIKVLVFVRHLHHQAHRLRRRFCSDPGYKHRDLDGTCVRAPKLQTVVIDMAKRSQLAPRRELRIHGKGHQHPHRLFPKVITLCFLTSYLTPPFSSSSFVPPSRSHSPGTTSPPAQAPPPRVKAQIPTLSSPANNPRTSCAVQSSRLPPGSGALSRSAAKMRFPRRPGPTPPRAEFSSLAPPAR